MTHAADVRLSEGELKLKQEAEQRVAVERALLRKDLNEVFSTAAGMHVLRFIMEVCQWEKSPVIGDQNGDPLPVGSIYNAAQQNIYRKLRSFLRKEILIPVEFKGLEKDEQDIFG